MRELTADRLRELLHYEPQTGHFWWRAKGRRRGQPAGYMRRDPKHALYRFILVEGSAHAAHRLAWLYVHGCWPDGQIDHINGDRSDNRLCNLRVVDTLANTQNQRRAHRDSKTGLIGARLTPEGNYRSEICVRGKKHDLGRYETAQQAHEAYVKAKREMHASCSI